MIETVIIILEQALLHMPLIIGAYISISLLKVPDLSIESAYVFGAIIGAKVLAYSQALPTGILLPLIALASLGGGMCVGLTSSLLTQKAGLPHLLSSILTFGIFHGIIQFIAGAYQSLSSYPNPLTHFANTQQHPELGVLMLIALIVISLAYLFFKTELGYACAVYGVNPQFFKHYNISTAYIFIAGILLSNGLAGLSGYLFAQSNNFIELNMGIGKALLCITALILANVVGRQKPLSVLKPLLGIFTYFTIQQLLLKVGFNLKYFTALQSLVVLVFLLYSYRTNDAKKSIDHLGV